MNIVPITTELYHGIMCIYISGLFQVNILKAVVSSFLLHFNQ